MIKNIRGETPLDLAAQFGHVDTVSMYPLYIVVCIHCCVHMHPLYCSMYPLLYI